MKSNEDKIMNSSFSTHLPTLQLAIDSTSLGYMKECLYKYYLTIVEGYTGTGEDSPHLRFGTEYHAALEQYDHARADGKTQQEAMIFAIRYALASTWDHELHRPWTSYDSNKNRETLIRSIVAYLTHFADDSLETYKLKNGKPAVELSFRLEPNWTVSTPVQASQLQEGDRVQLTRNTIGTVAWNIEYETIVTIAFMLDDNQWHEITCNKDDSLDVIQSYILCGHFDRIAIMNNSLYVVDRKTTKSTLNRAYFMRFNPDNQMSLYDFAARWVFPPEDEGGMEIKGIIIDAAQIQVDDTVLMRHPIEHSESALNEWIEDTRYWIAQAEYAAKTNHWPKNDKACGRVYEDPETGELQFGCPFRPVCGSAPEVREMLLDGHYEKRVWDPLKPRERKPMPIEPSKLEGQRV